MDLDSNPSTAIHELGDMRSVTFLFSPSVCSSVKWAHQPNSQAGYEEKMN